MYIVTESQLEKLAYNISRQPDSFGIYLTDFLKSKQPVEPIAEGLPWEISGTVVNWSLNQDQFKEFKIYIEVKE